MLNAEDAKRIASSAAFIMTDEDKVNEALEAIEAEINQSASKGLYQTSLYLNRLNFCHCIYDILRILQDSGYVLDISGSNIDYYSISIQWS